MDGASRNLTLAPRPQTPPHQGTGFSVELWMVTPPHLCQRSGTLAPGGNVQFHLQFQVLKILNGKR